MGSAQSSFTSESAVTGLVVAGTAAAYFIYDSSRRPSSKPAPPSDSATATGLKKSKKKARDADSDFDEILAAAAAAAPPEPAAVQPHVVPFPEVVPGTFDSQKEVSPGREPGAKEKRGKKKKGRKAAGAAAHLSQSEDASSVEPTSTSTPSLSAETASAAPKKEKKKKLKQSTAAQGASGTPAVAGPSTSSRPAAQQQIADDGHWTRVDRKRTISLSNSQGDLMTSDAGIMTSSVTETSSAATERTDDEESPTEENRRTFVEKMLPKPRKTGVEDMLETPLYPTVSRVMRVQPGPGEKPARGFSWDDYEDVEVSDSRVGWQESTEGNSADDDNGWGVVKSKRSKFDRTSSSTSSINAPRSTAPETLTKRQRQNVAKREDQKADKQAAEAERLRLLAKHKKEAERLKVDEQWKKRKGKVSGGMQATVDEGGSLSWE